MVTKAGLTIVTCSHSLFNYYEVRLDISYCLIFIHVVPYYTNIPFDCGQYTRLLYLTLYIIHKIKVMFLQNWYPRETSLLFTGRQMLLPLCSMSVNIPTGISLQAGVYSVQITGRRNWI